MVQLSRISKTFGNKRALSDVSLTISSRSTHILLGSSGSGKTTLMRILLGVLDADQGEIRMNDLRLQPKLQQVWSRNIGYVPQKGGLFPHLTALQNVKLVASTLGWNRAKIEDRMNSLLQVVSLEKALLKRYPNQLSGGQLQRVAIMRAAFLNPELLVFDEPLGALDPILRAEVQNELREIFRQLGKTVLLVTHDINEAQYFGDKFTLLRAGEVIQSGSFEDLLKHPSDPFVTQFINARRAGESLS